MKVVILTTVPGPKKNGLSDPPEANIEDIVKTFEMGTYLDVFSKFSNAYGLRYHD